MSPQRKRTFLIAAVVATAVLTPIEIQILKRGAEPSYAGRPLSFWVNELGPPSSPPTTIRAIQQIGTDGLPYLLSWIQYEPNPWYHKLDRIIWALTTKIPPRFDEKRYERANAATYAFRILGRQADPAIRELSHLMTLTNAIDTASRATYALAYVGGPRPLELLMTALTNRAPPLNSRTAAAIGEMGTNAAPALPMLIHCLDDKDPQLAGTAARCLGDIKLRPDIVVPALTNSFHSTTSVIVRRWAIRALGSFGPDARLATPTALTALNNPDEYVRRSATNTLQLITFRAPTNDPSE